MNPTPSATELPRVVFYLQGRTVPAARVRGVAVAEALASRGISCDVRVCRPSVYGDTDLPAPFARWRSLYAPASYLCRLGQMGDLRPDDIIWFQRPMVQGPWIFFERWAARGRRSLLDFDDAIYLNTFGRRKLRALVGQVDHVIAGNRTLAEAADAPEKTTIIPTVIDTRRFGFAPARGARGKDVVVGWTGTHGNFPQLASARRGIARALKETGARFLVIADRPPPPELAELQAEFLPWNPATEAADLSRIDIGVMPLPDSPYARGKCAFKLLQYMALGRPGVASPVGANCEVVTDGHNGHLARSDDDWTRLLIELIQDPDRRQQLGVAARQRVEESYSLPAVLPLYLAILRRLHGA